MLSIVAVFVLALGTVVTIYLIPGAEEDLVSQFPSRTISSLNRDTIETFELDGNYRLLVSETSTETTYAFLFKDDKLLKEYTLGPLSNDRNVTWQANDEPGQYSFLIGYFSDGSIMNANYVKLDGARLELDMLQYQDFMIFYSLSEEIDTPIYLEGLDHNGEVVYRNF